MTCERCAGTGMVPGPTVWHDYRECSDCQGSGFATPPATLQVSVTYLDTSGTSWLGTLDLDTMTVTPLFPVDDNPSVSEQDEVLAEYPLYDNAEVDA